MGFFRKVAALTAFFSVAAWTLSAQGGDGPRVRRSAQRPGIAAPGLGRSCLSSDDPGHVCMALKYVVFEDSRGVPVATPADALANLREINALHGRCNISFQIEEFEEVDPRRYGVPFHIANIGDLDAVREKFSDPDHLLIVTTGSWDRTGSLGNTSANAWTAMPGSAPYGAILEAPVARYSYIYAHELGHYLSLEHVDDAGDLMNPVIYQTSTELTPSQCETERSQAMGFWHEVTRSAFRLSPST